MISTGPGGAGGSEADVTLGATTNHSSLFFSSFFFFFFKSEILLTDTFEGRRGQFIERRKIAAKRSKDPDVDTEKNSNIKAV